MQQVILQPDLAPENTNSPASKSLGRPYGGMCKVLNNVLQLKQKQEDPP